MTDQDFLKLAIEEGNKVEAPYNFGAVVVKDGEVIGKDHAHVQKTNNPTLHAEACAIIAACKQLSAYNIDGCTLYASHEPCMMCLGCASWAHIDRVVYVTPASEQNAFDYELKDLPIKEFAAKFPRPMKVEQLSVN